MCVRVLQVRHRLVELGSEQSQLWAAQRIEDAARLWVRLNRMRQRGTPRQAAASREETSPSGQRAVASQAPRAAPQLTENDESHASVELTVTDLSMSDSFTRRLPWMQMQCVRADAECQDAGDASMASTGVLEALHRSDAFKA